MLSYRHIFHAGNHADVLKHLTLTALLDYLTVKDKPLTYIDTHAGAGRYPLTAAMAQLNREYAGGLEKLLGASDAPDIVRDYLAAVATDCGPTLTGSYPGSPLLAARMLREQDRLHLFELHPEDEPRLQQLLGKDRRIRIQRQDGLQGLIGLLPPPSRRALVLIDPSYEIKTEYRVVRDTLAAAIKRFATGVYAVWYPLLERREATELPRSLQSLGPRWLRAELQVRNPGPGMYGSGLMVINPPWGAADRLQQALPWLARTLAEDGGQRWRLDSAGLD